MIALDANVPVRVLLDDDPGQGALAAPVYGADFADAMIDAAARESGARDVVIFDAGAARKLGWTLRGIQSHS